MSKLKTLARYQFELYWLKFLPLILFPIGYQILIAGTCCKCWNIFYEPLKLLMLLRMDGKVNQRKKIREWQVNRYQPVAGILNVFGIFSTYPEFVK